MSIKLKSEFISSVTKQIRFPFDRKVIALELEDHLLELESYYFETTQDKDLAKSKAILEMGDPIEIGKALNQVHKPLWGWVWFISKVICIFLLCIIGWMSLQKVWDTFQSAREFESVGLGPIGILPQDYYLSTLGDNPANVYLLARYSSSEHRLNLDRDVIQFDDVCLYSDGTMIILYQDIKPIDPFGLGSEDYPLQLLSSLILPDGRKLNFRQDWPDIPHLGHILVVYDFPIGIESFSLKYEGYSDQFETLIRVSNNYEKK